jgi:hypothetical protein
MSGHASGNDEPVSLKLKQFCSDRLTQAFPHSMPERNCGLVDVGRRAVRAYDHSVDTRWRLNAHSAVKLRIVQDGERVLEVHRGHCNGVIAIEVESAGDDDPLPCEV